MNGGWVKIWRGIQGSTIWTEKPFSRGQAWVDLIMLANFQPAIIRVRGVKVVLERGQLGWSELALADRWGWSRGKVRRFLAEQQTEQRIVQQTTRVTSIITIVNYDAYQADDTTDDTTDGTTNGQQTDTDKKEKKGKKKENLPPSDEGGRGTVAGRNKNYRHVVDLLAETVEKQTDSTISPRKRSAWCNDLRLLDEQDGVDAMRQLVAVNWFTEQPFGGEYDLVIHSASAFRKKFTKLERRMNGYANNPNVTRYPDGTIVEHR